MTIIVNPIYWALTGSDKLPTAEGGEIVSGIAIYFPTGAVWRGTPKNPENREWEGYYAVSRNGQQVGTCKTFVAGLETSRESVLRYIAASLLGSPRKGEVAQLAARLAAEPSRVVVTLSDPAQSWKLSYEPRQVVVSELAD